MARIWITGSADGLGSVVAQQLVERGHTVYLHARNPKRAEDASKACPGAEGVIIGDLTHVEDMKKLAGEVNKHGPFDVIIHNAALFRGGYRKTSDGIPSLMAVNVVAPYVLTSLIKPPKRYVYVVSNMHRRADKSFKDPFWLERGEENWSDEQGYFDSKLYAIAFANAVAKHLPHVQANSVHPGWVVTKMGGENAPDALQDGVDTYLMLAEGKVPSYATARYYEPGKIEQLPEPEVHDENIQNGVLSLCEQITGIKLPSAVAVAA